jgi:Carboxypeptidase regulatory-like domain/TonB dependent receptor
MIFWHKFRNRFQHGIQHGRAARFAPLLLLVLCFTAVRAFAQINTGSLAGTVTDAAGGVLPGVAVTATETQSGSVYRTTTSSSGAYVFTSLRPGTYDVTAEAAGFKLSKATGIPVFVTTRASHDFALDVGAASDTVTVNADAPSLETETSDVGTVLTTQQVQDLPSQAGGAMRSLAALTLLTPGAVGTGTNGGTNYVKIGGGQTFGSDNLLDGLSTQRSENGTEFFDQMTPSLDAIEEFRVETLAPPAYLGRTTGGLANFKTRSGTNAYHGTVYDYFKNTIFDANNWFNKGNANVAGFTQDYYPGATPANPNPYRRTVDMHEDYGITLGGPVRIPHFYNGTDKTFFFFSYEQVPSTYSHAVTSVVPTVAQRAGDFSATLGTAISGVTNPCDNNNPVLAGQIFDPLTTQTVNGVECRKPFANNQVPIGRSAVAQKVLALIPQPNEVAAGNVNYIYNSSEKVNQFDYSLRLDQNFGTRHHLFFFANARENFDSGIPNFPGPIDSGGNQQDFFAKLLRIGYDFTISPRLINQINLGGNRINSFNSAPPAFNGVNYDGQLGIPNTPASGNTFPVFGIQDMSGLGSPNADDNVDNALLVDDNLSWQKGKHGIRVGGTYRWTQFSYENNGPAAGNFNFGRTQTAGTNNATAETQSGNGIASFLLGTPSSTGRSLQVHFPRWIQNYYAVYAQDDWKLLHDLTLNLGIRYSIDTPRHEAEGDISSFDPTEPNPAANGLLGALHYGGVGTGRDGNKGQQFASTYHKNIEPRIGFAYSPSFVPAFLKDKFVLRGAYTIMAGPLVYADYGQGLSAGFTTNTAPQTNDPFTYPAPLDSGPPTLSLSPIIDSTYDIGGGVDYLAKTDGRPASVQNWTLETQTQLLPDLILTVGYLGERGTHLRSLVYWENSLNPAYFALGDTLYQPVQSAAGAAAGIQTPFPNFFNVTNGQVGQALEPHPAYGYINNDSYLQNRGQSTYNAMEVKVDRKFRNGLNLLAGYTYSKTFTDADSIQPYFATVLAQSGTQNPYNLKAERSVSEQDVTNNFVASYLYELPVGKGKKFVGNSNKIIDTIVGGYRIGGVLRYVSGQPVGFFGAQGVPYFDGGIRFSRAVGNTLLTPAAKSGHYNPFNFTANYNTNNVNPSAFFSRDAFIDVNDATHRGSGPYSFGNLPRNDTEWRTNGYAQEDMNLNKHFNIHEQIAADLRWEVFNVFNRHGFGKPDSGVNDTTFGWVNSLNDLPRNMQLVLKIRY